MVWVNEDWPATTLTSNSAKGNPLMVNFPKSLGGSWITLLRG